MFVCFFDTHTHTHTHTSGLPWLLSGKESTCSEGDKVWSLSWEDSLKKEMPIHSSILSGKSHGQRTLVGYCPWGQKWAGHCLSTEQQQIHVHVRVCVYIYIFIYTHSYNLVWNTRNVLAENKSVILAWKKIITRAFFPSFTEI